MNLRRRQFLKTGASGVALLAAAGCHEVPQEVRKFLAWQSHESNAFSPPLHEGLDPLTHFLNRTTFGPRPGDYEKINRLGSPSEAIHAYLEKQLQPEKIEDDYADSIVRRFETLNEPLGELFEYQDDLLQQELMRATLARAVWSERQLYEVMVQFWSDHFNIDPSKGDSKWLKVADDREVIRRHALGKFTDMLRASALSPAMLWYLDGRVNRRDKPSDKPNENYARELLELHTLGVHGGYSQTDVMEVARCLTGWKVRSTVEKPYFQVGLVEFDLERHDAGEKHVLNHRIAAIPPHLDADARARLGRHELDRVLQIATRHPSTARHIATKLCRHFIADDPPESAVTRVAEVFAATEGDIPATLRALFGTTDFQETRGNKLKRPFHFIASALRATDARTDSGLPLIEYLQRMGHAPFNFPTPDGYPDHSLPWMGTLLWRWNFAVSLSRNQIGGTNVDFELLRKNSGGDHGLMAHLLGRKPASLEAEAYHESGEDGLALLLASPAFQRC